MNVSDSTAAKSSGAAIPVVPLLFPKALVIGLSAITAVLAFWLIPLFQFARADELFSYILLIPLVSGYFIWTERPQFDGSAPLRGPLFAVTAIVGIVLLGATLWTTFAGADLPRQDMLALAAAAYVALLWTACLYLAPRNALAGLRFPLIFLIFLIPFPTALHAGIEYVLQHLSAATASWMFQVIGTPIYLEGTLMQLPGFVMEVAPECSGIRSSVVLLITSIIAGKFFLKSGWSRLALAALVLPISIVRNALRITVIGELCVNIGPHMIHSWIHRRGGPLFFAISLIPLLVAVWLLIRAERKRA